MIDAVLFNLVHLLVTGRQLSEEERDNYSSDLLPEV